LTDTALYDVLSVVLATLLVGFGLAGVISLLRRSRPELTIAGPVALGVGARLVAIAGVGLSGLGATLRGGDEATFLRGAREVAASGLDSGPWLPSESHRLHEIVFALQIKIADFPEAALRVTQVGIAMLGIVLIVVAIYDAAGPRAARLGAWVLAFEPASIFFNGILHREPLLVLASGLVVLGGARIWARPEPRGTLLLALGCAIALGTRPYAGWFLITGGLLLILHASLRASDGKRRSLPLAFAVALVAVAAAPAVLRLTSQQSLEQNLQHSQDVNTDPNAPRGAAGSNNLSLERVDFSTRSDLVAHLPSRLRDVVLRPYPWQVANPSQQLGAVGTLVALVTLGLLLQYVRRNRGETIALAAPFLYPTLFLLIAYALSVGNAGTGFRYRTHLVILGLATLIVLRQHALRGAAAADHDAPGTGVARTGPAMRLRARSHIEPR